MREDSDSNVQKPDRTSQNDALRYTLGLDIINAMNDVGLGGSVSIFTNKNYGSNEKKNSAR